MCYPVPISAGLISCLHSLTQILSMSSKSNHLSSSSPLHSASEIGKYAEIDDHGHLTSPGGPVSMILNWEHTKVHTSEPTRSDTFGPCGVIHIDVYFLCKA